MKKITTHIVILLFSTKALLAQGKSETEIRTSKIKLCDLKLSDLKESDKNLKEVEVVEMDLCSDGFVQDSRFENRKGYVSSLYPGIIFQKNSYDEYISKLRLTKSFKGYLPDETYVDLEKLKAKNIPEKYLNLNNWSSRGCSDYWSINNDTIYFYVAIEKNKEPRYPLDEPFYLSKAVDAIDIVSNCYKFHQNKQVDSEPLYILDGKEVGKNELELYKPHDIESVTVLKESGVEKYGQKGRNGVIIIVTKSSAGKKQ